MSMDYLKSVYYPVRDETRKVTSYGQMNVWHDYKKPLSKRDRPRNKLTNPDEKIDHGVELKVPTHEKKKHFIERSRLDELLEEAQLRNYHLYHGSPTEDKKYQIPRRKYLSPLGSKEEPVFANGRIVIPDPMTLSAPVHLGYGDGPGYDDHHKTYLKLQQEGIYPSYPLYGPPRLHNGKVGGTWKHVRNVLQAKGSRALFLDGTPRWVENNKIMNNEVPGTAIMYPVHRRKINKAMTEPLKIGQKTTSHKEAMRQTEGGNWNLLR